MDVSSPEKYYSLVAIQYVDLLLNRPVNGIRLAMHQPCPYIPSAEGIYTIDLQFFPFVQCMLQGKRLAHAWEVFLSVLFGA